MSSPTESQSHSATDEISQLATLEREVLNLNAASSPAAVTARRSFEAYQELCNRYAYNSTFFPGTRLTRSYLAAVHRSRRLIYGNRLSRSGYGRPAYLDRLPASFRALRWYLALAFLLGAGGAAIAALLVFINPAVAWTFLSEEMADGLRRGSLWTEGILGYQSFAAAQITLNNIRVSFTVFALGITGGIGTAVMLLYNGAMLGALFAALQSYGMSGKLLEFVVAHGVLELSIIIVCAGCGLAIGDALISPGAQSRAEALKHRGKQAMDLVFISALALIPAGLTEALISPDPKISFATKCCWGIAIGTAYWCVISQGTLKPDSPNLSLWFSKLQRSKSAA
jgi:uncharacterized membrane protein SpoIIM required for sporulation